MKKFYFMSLFMILFFVFYPITVNASGETKVTSNGLVYSYFSEEENSIEIVGYEGNEKRVTIPSEIESKPVITIGEEAFYYNESIEEIVFEGNLKSIGLGSFYECENLKSVTFCDSIEIISTEAFAYCYNLTDIVFPENLTEIGEDSFVETAITNITIPESVSVLWNNAFGSCDNLVSIDVADGNEDYSSVDGVLYNKNKTKLICCPAGKRSVDIEDTVLQIEQKAFYFCDKINEIILPESISRIGDEAFRGTSISQLIIPKKTSFIGEYVFYACSKLSNIDVESENVFYASENGVLFNKQKTKLICCPSQKSDINIPDTVIEIGMASFGCCDQLTMLIIPNSVTTIGEEAFAWAENLSYLYVPESVVEIGRAALSDVLRIDCNAKSVIEKYAIEHGLNYTIHKHNIVDNQVCAICGKIIPVATGKFVLLKSFLLEKGQTDYAGNKYFQDTVMVSAKRGNTATISYIEDEAKFKFCCKDINGNQTVSTITMFIDENGSQTVTVDYSHDVFSLNASATFDVSGYTPNGKVYFEKTSSSILDNSEIQDLCNAELKSAFTGWDLVLAKNFGFDVNMADMGFTSYEKAGTHTWNSGKVTKKATCGGNGIKTYICTICGATMTEDIPKLNSHTWNSGVITRKATVTSEGEKTYTCTICKETRVEKIPKLKVAKKSQKIKVTTSKKISAKKVKNKAQSFKLSAKSTSGNRVKYKLAKGNKNIKFAESSGKVTVKKGTKKGTYKIKVKMTVSGNSKYKAYSTKKTITIKVIDNSVRIVFSL